MTNHRSSIVARNRLDLVTGKYIFLSQKRCPQSVLEYRMPVIYASMAASVLCMIAAFIVTAI